MPAAAASQEDAARQALEQAERQAQQQQATQQQAAERARQAAAEANGLAQQRIEAMSRLRVAEAATADAAARIDELTQQRTEAQQRLRARVRSLRPFLPLMERLSLYPNESLLTAPAPPAEALRGLLVLRGLVRHLQAEADALRKDAAARDAAIAELKDAASRLAAAEAAQKAQADALDQQIQAAHARQAEAEADAQLQAGAAAEVAARTQSLHAALQALESQRLANEAKARAEAAALAHRKQAEQMEVAKKAAIARQAAASGTMTSDAEPHGQLQFPVVGVTVTGWGQQTEGGPATGLSIHAPPSARVVSPCGGQAVFAEPFRSYGLLLIINCGGGYNVVMGGFDRLNVKVGQPLVAGEPVGVMPSWEPGSSAHRPALYVELRRNGRAINPEPWLHPIS